MKNILDGVNIWLDFGEENISELENFTITITLVKSLALSYKVKNALLAIPSLEKWKQCLSKICILFFIGTYL